MLYGLQAIVHRPKSHDAMDSQAPAADHNAEVSSLFIVCDLKRLIHVDDSNKDFNYL